VHDRQHSTSQSSHVVAQRSACHLKSVGSGCNGTLHETLTSYSEAKGQATTCIEKAEDQAKYRYHLRLGARDVRTVYSPRRGLWYTFVLIPLP
jgi:hypothetical protein